MLLHGFRGIVELTASLLEAATAAVDNDDDDLIPTAAPAAAPPCRTPAAVLKLCSVHIYIKSSM